MTRSRRSAVLVVMAALAAVLYGFGSSHPARAQASAPPALIPALQEWSGAEGTFDLTPMTRIVSTSTDLDAVADTFVDDLRLLSGEELAVTDDAGDGGIVLEMGDVGLPVDGHVVDITPQRVTIRGATARAVFLGTRTILQLAAVDPALPTGTVRDWPRYQERGLMVDLGRKHHTVEWLEQHIKDLAYLKMNLLHLHLSDDPGFRIESERHPEIVSEVHLTKAEVRHLLDVAERYHVTVVPEIDMPGHMTQILATHPEFQLRDALGQPNPTALDVTNPDARAFAREIIEEYLELFPGPYWHGGADEYLHLLNQPALPAEPAYPTYPDLLAYAQAEYGPTANHKDAYLDFINWMDDLVASHGKQLRIWADGLHGGSAVTVHADIPVEWWQFNSPNAPASGLLAAGHPIVNAGWNPTYQSAAFYAEWTGQAKNELYWDEWEVHEFWGLEDAVTDGLTAPRDEVSPDEPRNLGSKVHLWYDEPDTITIEESAIR